MGTIADKLAYTAAQTLAIRTVTGSKVGKDLTTVPLSQIPTEINNISGGGEPLVLTGNANPEDVRAGSTFYKDDANTKLTGTLVVDEPLPEWWEVEAPVELQSGTLFAGVAPDGTAFFSTSDANSGLWKLVKATRTFTRVVESGSYNTFQTVGNHSLIITSTSSSGQGIITHYNGTTSVGYETGYNWITRKISDDGECAFLGTTSTSQGNGLIFYKLGNTSLVVNTGISWTFQDYKGITFIWSGSSSATGVWKFQNDTWLPITIVEQVWDKNYSWTPYVDEPNDVFFLIAYSTADSGIIVWESNQFNWRYTSGAVGSYYIYSVYKYSNDVYYISLGSGGILKYTKSTNLIVPITGTNGLGGYTVLKNGYVVWHNPLRNDLNGVYAGYIVHNPQDDSISVQYAGGSFANLTFVYDLGDSVLILSSKNSSGTLATIQMHKWDYATMTKTDMVSTYGWTLSTDMKFDRGIVIKDKVLFVFKNSTLGTYTYNILTNTFTKTSNVFNSGNISDNTYAGMYTTKFEITNDDEFLIEDTLTYYGESIGVLYYKYSTDNLIRVVSSNGWYSVYDKIVFPSGAYYSTENAGTFLFNRATQVKEFFTTTTASTQLPRLLETTNYIYVRGATTGKYGIWRITKSDASITQLYSTTNSYMIPIIKATSDYCYLVTPSQSTIPCLHISSSDVITELPRTYASYDRVLAEKDNVIYTCYYSISDRNKQGIVAFDLTTLTYSLYFSYGQNYDSVGKYITPSKELWVGNAYIFNYTTSKLLKVSLTGDIRGSGLTQAINNKIYLTNKYVVDIDTESVKQLYGNYVSDAIIQNNYAVNRADGYILYGEVD